MIVKYEFFEISTGLLSVQLIFIYATGPSTNFRHPKPLAKRSRHWPFRNKQTIEPLRQYGSIDRIDLTEFQNSHTPPPPAYNQRQKLSNRVRSGARSASRWRRTTHVPARRIVVYIASGPNWQWVNVKGRSARGARRRADLGVKNTRDIRVAPLPPARIDRARGGWG